MIPSMGTALLALRALTSLVFATAGASKLAKPGTARRTLKEFGVDERLSALGVALAPIEISVAAALMLTRSARWGALVAGVLLLVFTGAMVRVLRSGRRPDCGCFGGVGSAPVSVWSLARNAILFLASLLVAAAGPGDGVGVWTSSHGAVSVAALALAVLIAALVVMFGMRPRSASLDLPAHTAPAHTRAGEQAAAFSLQDADGRDASLSSLLSGGLPLVLVFANATCGSCLALLGPLARWQRTLAGSLRLVLVGIGDPDEVRAACRLHAISEVLLDQDASVATLLGTRATPSAVAIAPSGVITCGPVIGAEAVEDLVRLTLERCAPVITPWKPTRQAA